MGVINKEVVVFQIEDMLSNINKENLLTNGGCIENGTAFLELMTNVLTVLKEQPEIVRCKDCKHGKSYSEEWYGCKFGAGLHEPDWFCADGERAENARLNSSEIPNS